MPRSHTHETQEDSVAMIRQLLVTGASALALTLSIPAAAQDEAEEDLPVMTYGTWGIDPTLLDPSVDAGDDFFAYANGKWVSENPIPAAYSRYGAFDALRQKSNDDVKVLIDELVSQQHAPGSAEQRIVDAYEAFYDTAAMDASGLTPAYPYLTEIFTANSLTDLAKLWGKAGFDSPVGAYITVDSKDPTSYITAMGMGGLGLPDRDYYLDNSERNQEIQAKYRELLAFMLGKAGYADPEDAAGIVYDLEHRFAEAHWDRAVSRNRDLTYNKLDRAELASASGGFPLDAMLAESGLSGVDHVLVSRMPPSAEEIEELGLTEDQLAKIGGGWPAMLEIIANEPVANLKAWMAAHFLMSNASILTTEMDTRSFEFFGKMLNGTEEQQPRWKRAIAATEGQLGEVLGKVYAERYFPAANKAAMVELVGNLRKALGESLAENDWMTDATKVKAKEKLDAFDPMIGYPDKFKTYDGLEITADNPVANRIGAQAWQWQYDLARIDEPVDRGEWGMLPQTVNAYYSPVMNQIVFPAAILQPPFFNISADMAVNYGAIGGVIGHEMGHGFDDQGAKSDGSGKLTNWWSPEDKAAFNAKGDALAAQYDAFCPFEGDSETCVNGRLTLGENIGDLSGLSLAYRAYKLALNGEEAPVIDGLTGDQRFFLAWAQVWRSAIRPDALRQQMLTDPHSPAEFRVNGPVRNVDAWYDAFGVTKGDDLYLPPEKRVHIW